MSESSADEREGWQEAPEQPEPPRVRNGADKKAVLPADAELKNWYTIPRRKSLPPWPPMRA
jgi:hypothetical protein